MPRDGTSSRVTRLTVLGLKYVGKALCARPGQPAPSTQSTIASNAHAFPPAGGSLDSRDLSPAILPFSATRAQVVSAHDVLRHELTWLLERCYEHRSHQYWSHGRWVTAMRADRRRRTCDGASRASILVLSTKVEVASRAWQAPSVKQRGRSSLLKVLTRKDSIPSTTV